MPADRSELDHLLAHDVRVRRGSRMVRTHGPLGATTIAEIKAALLAYMRDADLSQADVAKAVGSSSTYINNLLNESAGLPPETRDQLWRDLNNWLDREARARENARPATFVETRVAERMMQVAERLADRPDMAIVYGPAGIGKTITCEALAPELRAVYVRAARACRTPGRLMHKLYNAISRRPRTRQNVTLDELVERLRRPDKVAACNVLIVDQAHELKPESFALLMDLHDLAKCSVLMVGTVDLRKAVDSDADPEFGQLASRVGMRINLAQELSSGPRGGRGEERLFTAKDIRDIFNRSKIKLHPSAVRMLLQVANFKLGALRRCDRLVFQAERIAARKGVAQILPDHLVAAALLIGEELVFTLPADEPAPERQEATA